MQAASAPQEEETAEAVAEPVESTGLVESAEPDASDEAVGNVESGMVIDYSVIFPSWNPDSASLKELVDFVSDTTDESSPNYLDPADRIDLPTTRVFTIIGSSSGAVRIRR